MKEFDVGDLKEGMVFPGKLFTAEGYRLAEPFLRLDGRQIRQLSHWEIETIHSHREPLSDEVIETYRTRAKSRDVGDVLDESELEPGFSYHENRQRARSVNQSLKDQVRDGYHDALNRTRNLLRPLSKGLVSDTRRLYRALRPIYDSVWHLPKTVLFFLSDRSIDTEGEYIHIYSLNTALYSILLARELQLDLDEAKTLGAAALVHDLGMFKISQTIRKKEREYTDEERKVMEAHPVKGARMLKNLQHLESSVIQTVLQHHEQYDGEGYPRQLAGEEIHFYARIVHLAMTFTAMTQPRYHRPARSMINSIQFILTEESDQFDPQVLDAFKESIGIYPVGFFVRLKSDCQGMIVSANAENPESPEVNVLTDREGKMIEEPYLINLNQDPDEIERVLNQEEIEYSSLELS